MKKYLIKTLIQTTIIGSVVFLLELAILGKNHMCNLSPLGDGMMNAYIWCVLSMTIAFVGMDAINGKLKKL